MEVKGTAFLARKAMLIGEIGQERFDALMRRFRATHGPLLENVLATSVLPLRPFLDWNELIVREVYRGDVQSYFRIGQKSAEWGLTQGPYKHLVATKSYEQFAQSGRVIYASYFTKGRAESGLRGNVVEMRLMDIPREFHHAYLEYAIAGYFQRGLELVAGGPVDMKPVRGFTKGDPDVLYEYRPRG